MLRGVIFTNRTGAIIVKVGISSTYSHLTLPQFCTNSVAPMCYCGCAVNTAAVLGIIWPAGIAIKPFPDDTRISTAGCAIADILCLSCLNDAIQQNFEFYAAIGAATLCSAKTRGLDGGILAVCAVMAVFTILSILTVYAIADISRLGALNHAIQKNFNLGAAVGASTLRTAKTRGLDGGILAVCAVCAVFTVLSVLSILPVYAIFTVANITRVKGFCGVERTIVVCIQADVDAHTAIGTIDASNFVGCGHECILPVLPVLPVLTIFSVLSILTIHAIAYILRLISLNDVIDEDFDLDAAIGAITLWIVKSRCADAGISAVCHVLAICSVTDIASVEYFVGIELAVVIRIYTFINANATGSAVFLCPVESRRMNFGICAILATADIAGIENLVIVKNAIIVRIYAVIYANTAVVAVRSDIIRCDDARIVTVLATLTVLTIDAVA